MNRMKHLIVGLLLVSVLTMPLGITGCGDGGKAQKAKQEELAREAEYQQRLREEKLRQTQLETQKKQSEANGQDLENVETAIGIGAVAVGILAWLFSGDGGE